MGSAPPQRRWWPFEISLPLTFGLCAYATALARGDRLLDDPDPYWHIVVGNWMIAHHAVPHYDIFSHSVPRIAWVPHEWLAEVAMAATYNHLGWSGLRVAAALSFAAALTLLLRALLRYLEPIYALIAAGTACGLCLPHLLARPHVLTLPLFVLWLSILVAARHDDRAPSPWAALLMLLWANLHGGYVLGIGLAALFAGEMTLDQPSWLALRFQAFRWSIFLALSVVAACITPLGVDGILIPFRLISMRSVMAMVTEWQAPDFQYAQPLEPYLMLVLLGALSFGIRLPVTRVAMLLLLLHLALAHQRFAGILGLAAPLLIAPSLAPQLSSPPTGLVGSFRMRFAQRASPRGLVLAGGFAALLATAVVSRDPTHDTSQFTPGAAVAFVRANQITGPVFNDYDFGGYLIFAGIAPFIDGRAEMYGDDFISRYRDITALPALLAKYRITWTLLKPKDGRTALLDRLPGWHRQFADDRAVVHVHDSGMSQ
jgi:hypothetical protein